MPQTEHIEQHFTASESVRDVVIGMSDGLTVPFALAAGLSGAVTATRIVVTAGFAEIAAGAIAMGWEDTSRQRATQNTTPVNSPANSGRLLTGPRTRWPRSRRSSLHTALKRPRLRRSFRPSEIAPRRGSTS